MYNPFQETIIPDVTDEDLVLQAQNGDWDALEQLIGRHQAWIFNIAVRMVRQPQEAEDITQEVLLESCRCQPRLFSRRMERFAWPLLMKISLTGWNQRPCSMVCGLWGAMGQ